MCRLIQPLRLRWEGFLTRLERKPMREELMLMVAAAVMCGKT
jgi:hypothetical protein